MLCQRWGQVPSAILAENAGIVSGILLSLGESAPPQMPQLDPKVREEMELFG